MKILENDSGMRDMFLTENDDGTYCVYEDKEKLDSKKPLKTYATLAECNSFLDGIYWTCMQRLFGGYKT